MVYKYLKNTIRWENEITQENVLLFPEGYITVMVSFMNQVIKMNRLIYIHCDVL
jgi:hypothetical protein